MIYEFSIDPESLNDCNALKHLYDCIGYEHGRLISAIPAKKKWLETVKCLYKSKYDNKQISENEYSVITEILSIFQKHKYVLKFRRTHSEVDWLDTTIKEHAADPFKAIVTCREANPPIQEIISTDEIYNTNRYWCVESEKSVERNGIHLAEVASPLLLFANQIILVDPYFDPKLSKWANTIKAIMNIVQQRPSDRGKPTIEIHTDYSDNPNRGRDFSKTNWKNRCQNLKRFLPPGLLLTVYRWRNRINQDRMHPRYLLSNLGGLQYDKGIDEVSGDSTVVKRISRNENEENLKIYNMNGSLFLKEDEVALTN